MLRIGIDAMGGDHAPEAIVEGAIMALGELNPQSRMVLFGNRGEIERILNRQGTDPGCFDIVHTTEVISMDEHSAKAFTHKTDSSVTVGFHALKNGTIDGFASAGSTGAMMVGAVSVIGTIENILRPSISVQVSTLAGGKVLLLDAGLNVDTKPESLAQNALIGHVYAKAVLGMENPRIALLNIGEEREKGPASVKTAYELMNGDGRFNFIGNIEANEIFTGLRADVVVCDGFVGNTILKQTEGFYEMCKARGIKDDYIDKLNYEYVGGTAVLGINAVVLIGHGRSSPLAVKNMILQTENSIKAGLVKKLQETFLKL